MQLEMSKLDEAMLKHMRHIVTNEHRPFSYLDFLAFEVEGHGYHLSHGTFRNKISAIMKRAGLDVVSYSPQGFYTLKGVEIANSMERNHTGVTLSSNLAGQPPRYLKNHPIYRVIQNTPFDKSALHDIRLRFSVQGIWAVLSTSDNLTIDPVSKDIRLISQEINDVDIIPIQ
jgi:hypothetical protein